MKKQMLAVLLTLCMVWGLLPARVLAANNSGTCGKNLTWTLENGILTINGAGAMDNYDEIYVEGGRPAPWFTYAKEITTVVIGLGVTSIGECALSGLREVTSITLPKTVQSIGWGALSECQSVKEIKIPSSVSEIGFGAFTNWDSLTDVYYGGNNEAWKKIVIAEGNEDLTNAEIHYNNATKPGSSIPSPFTDIQDTPTTNWYYNPILWAVANNVTNGISDTEFAPNNTCTRAQAVAFLWRAAGRPEPSSAVNPFVDVVDTADTNWYYKAVLWAVEKGITTGTGATHFSPEGEVSRGQMVTFLWRMHEKPTAEGSTFADVPANEYYYNAVSWAVTQGITNGTSVELNTFEPLTTCSRAHIVTFLYRDLVG